MVVTRSMLTDEWTQSRERPGLTGTERFAGRDAFSDQLLAVCDVLCTATTCPEGDRLTGAGDVGRSRGGFLETAQSLQRARERKGTPNECRALT